MRTTIRTLFVLATIFAAGLTTSAVTQDKYLFPASEANLGPGHYWVPTEFRAGASSVEALIPEGMRPQANIGGVRLSAEDQARLTRLREEILGRAYEIGRIVNRTLNRPVPAPIGKFSVTDSGAGSKKTEVQYWLNGQLVAVGCWDEETEECYAGPCQ